MATLPMVSFEKRLTSSSGGGGTSGDRCAVGLTDAFEAAVGLAGFSSEAAANEVLQFFVGPEAEHFFATADSIFQF